MSIWSSIQDAFAQPDIWKFIAKDFLTAPITLAVRKARSDRWRKLHGVGVALAGIDTQMKLSIVNGDKDVNAVCVVEIFVYARGCGFGQTHRKPGVSYFPS